MKVFLKKAKLSILVQKLDIIQKCGSWYSYGDERIGQGRENAKQFLKENPAIREEVANKIRESYGLAWCKLYNCWS